MSNASEPILSSWHIKKEIQITHIFTTLGLVIAAVTAFNALESRVSLTELELTHARLERERLDKEQEDILSRIEDRLIRIEDKLEKKADK